MPGLIAVAGALLPLLYLALLADYASTFFLRTRTHARSPHLLAVVAVHLGYLTLWSMHAGRPPVATTPEILSVLAVATAAVYAWVELATRDRRTGVFVLLLAFLFQYAGSYAMAGHAQDAAAPAATGLWTRLHVLPALVAYTALGFAGVFGALDLAARRDLRARRFGVLFDRLPPLEALGPMAWHALLTGFVAMTLAIAVTPLMFGGEGGGAMSAKVVGKIVTGSVAWAVCAAGVFGHWLGRWTPARTSAVAVIGFLLVMALLAVSGVLG